MPSIEKIISNGELLAVIIRKNFKPKEVEFITSKDSPLQVGVQFRKKGLELKPHMHKKRKRTINETLEILHIDEGKVKMDIYNAGGKKVASKILNSGDTVLAISGHGFKILKNTRIMEIKQGPYVSVEVDKKWLE